MRAFALALTGGLLFVSVIAGAASGTRPTSRQRVSSLDDVLDLYARGDFGVVARTFAMPRDFQRHLRPTDTRDLDRWLGTWNRAKAVLLLDMARASSGVAPHYFKPLLLAGRRYVTTGSAGRPAPSDTAQFVSTWNRAAIALLEGAGEFLFLDDLTTAMASEPAGSAGDLRLALARAVAQEQRCSSLRPTIEQPGDDVAALNREAGAAVRRDLDGPTPAGMRVREEVHRACLREAASRFDAAAAEAPTRAEALVRGAWILFQEGRHGEAIVRLDQADPGSDRDVAYWRGLIRGRVFDALGRFGGSAEAYRSSLLLFPHAQTAAVGHAVALLRLDRDAEADAAARALRAAPLSRDPWGSYRGADARFIDGLLDQLRGAMK